MTASTTTYAFEVRQRRPAFSRMKSLEWEHEAWPDDLHRPNRAREQAVHDSAAAGAGRRIRREISLPTNVVIDLTTWGNAFQERSQFPAGVINPYTGYVDILLYPNGDGGSDDDLFVAVVVRHVGCVLPLLAGGAE